MKTVERNLVTAALWSIALGSFIISCAASNQSSSALTFVTPTPTPTPSAATPTPVGATPVPGAYTLTVTASLPSYVPHVLHGTSSWNSSCSVSVTGGTPAVTNQCLLEIEEFDLAANDWSLNWSVGLSGCPYVVVQPYWFMQYAGGQGPTAIAYTVLEDGAIDPSSVSQISPGGGTLFSVVDNTIKCNYDHTGKFPAGPNACYGSYTEAKTVISTTGTVTTTTKQLWGGLPGNAAAGPAADEDWGRAGRFEYPVWKYYPTYAGGSGTIPIKKMIPEKNTNLYSENYQTNPAISVGMLSQGNPYYTFQCVDGGLEVLGQIRVSVRGWNLAAELAKGSTGTASSSGSQNGDVNNDYYSIDDVKADTVTYPLGYPEHLL